MPFKENYIRKKEKLLASKKICEYNRKLFRKFFDWEERKLRRINNIREVDEKAYKTLYHYTSYFPNVNKWFKNKPWNKITKKEIEQVYNDLEDGKIKRKDGKPFMDRQSYYGKVFKSKPFALAGKDKLAIEIIQYTSKNNDDEVSFLLIDDVKKNIDLVSNLTHKTFLQVCSDIGENPGSILKLIKRDCTRQINKDNNEPEYLINLRKEILKRSRTHRTEPTLFIETVNLLDLLLKDKKDDDLLFNFGDRQGEKIWSQCIKKTRSVCIPTGKKPSISILRKSIMCHLLNVVGWSESDIKGRLGHKPSSRVLDKYVSYFAINKYPAKKKVFDNDYRKLKDEMVQIKEVSKHHSIQLENHDKLLGRLLEIYEANPEIADRMIIKQPQLVREMFNL